MKMIKGGITAPKGFKAAGTACGIKKNNQLDLALVVSEKKCSAAAVFTKNVVKGHSLKLTIDNLKYKTAKAVVINSGNANACVGPKGDEAAKNIVAFLSEKLQCNFNDVIINSTGVIGVALDSNKICTGLEQCINNLSTAGGKNATEAIMTTDTYPKECAVSFFINGKEVTIGGMAKGSGMIHPNLATMIGVLTTDADINSELLDNVLKKAISKTFNRISVDGDTSVCDMVVVLANGESNCKITSNELEVFSKAVEKVCTNLSKSIAKDGEGATKLIEIYVNNSLTKEDAYKIACSIAKSPLVKTAIFGEDANWGRIITAAGYSGADFDPDKIDIFIGDIKVCENGTALLFDEQKAKDLLALDEVKIIVDLKQGKYCDRMWTCDFSYDYIKINGSYRT